MFRARISCLWLGDDVSCRTSCGSKISQVCSPGQYRQLCRYFFLGYIFNFLFASDRWLLFGSTINLLVDKLSVWCHVNFRIIHFSFIHIRAHVRYPASHGCAKAWLQCAAFVRLTHSSTDYILRLGYMIGTGAVMAGEFGHGRVIVFGPHPECSSYDLIPMMRNALFWTVRKTQPKIS